MKRIFYETLGAIKVLILLIVFGIGGTFGMELQKERDTERRENKEFARGYVRACKDYNSVRKQK